MNDKPSLMKNDETAVSDITTSVKSIEDLRNRILSGVFLTFTILGFFSTMAGVMKAWPQQNWGLIAFYIGVYLIAPIGLVLGRHVSFNFRSCLGFIVIYGISIHILARFGLSGAGVWFLLLLSVLSTVLINLRMGLITIAGGILGLAVIGILITNGIIIPETHIWLDSSHTTSWWLGAALFVVLGGVGVVALGTLHNHLETSLTLLKQREQELVETNNRLHQKADERQQIQDKLRKHQQDLEKIVAARTAELQQKNVELENEIRVRLHAERNIRIQRDLGLALSTPIGLKEDLQLCLTAAIRIADMDSGGIYLLNHESGDLTLATHSGLAEEFVQEVSYYDSSTAQAMLVVAGKPIFANAETLKQLTYDISDLEGIESFCAIPIQHDGQVVASLNLASHQEKSFSLFTQNLLEGIISQIAAVITTHHDRQELIRSEERFRTIYTNAPVMIVGVGPDRKLRFWNHQAEKDLGWSYDEAIHHPNILQACYPDPAAYEKTIQGLQTHDGLFRESRPIAKDGRQRIQLWADFQLPDNSLIGVGHDVTEAKQTESRKMELEAQLRQQQKLEAIGTLASGVAHEINNPINIIINYAQLISDHWATDSKLTAFAENILSESDRIAEIVKSLLAFARMDSETLGPGDIRLVLNDISKLMGQILLRDQVMLSLDIPEDLPLAKCRPQQVMQVLMNLIANARDALNERYPKSDSDKKINIQVRVYSDEQGKWLRTSVEDFGTGIPDEIRERIFDPFFTTKPRNIGTGLGLSVSHGIIEDHHGRILVESEPGRFCRFYVDLPLF